MKVLENIPAQLCPPCGGDAVYRARALLALHDPLYRFDVKEGDCVGRRSAVDGGFEEQESLTLIRPNPTSGEFTLSMGTNPDVGTRAVRLFSLTGQLLAERQLSPDNDQEKLSFPNLKDGTYLVSVFEDGKLVYSERMVVAK